jgi:uncharacterized RDD family membrane protein YckC
LSDATAVEDVEYVGFWVRFVAFLIDSLLVSLTISPLVNAIYRSHLYDNLSLNSDPAQMLSAITAEMWSPGSRLSFLLTAIAVIVFWIYKSATPGKMIFSARIVDARSGGPITTGQAIGRYFAYYVSALALCLGFLWIAFDARKQGFHDKLANTVVIRTRRERNPTADFKGPPPPLNRG